MSTEHFRSGIADLCRYSVASADMYYSEEGMRDLFLAIDDRGNFHIEAQTVGEDISTEVDLCEIFLEYAMYCSTCCSPESALSRMQGFAQQTGRAIGEFVRKSTDLLDRDHCIERALEHLFQTMNAHVRIQSSGAVEHVTVIDCPLENAARHSGLRNIELARHGMNIMCQNVVQAVNADLALQASPDIRPEFDFTIQKPELA